MEQMQRFIFNLNKQLESNLAEIIQYESTINQHQHTIKCFYDIILQLKSFILNYTFNNTNEEIEFFKQIKPKYISEYIFNNKALQILIRKPIGNNASILNYLENSLNEITSFFNVNLEFYEYYRLNSTYKDGIYFVRQKNEPQHFTNAYLNNFEPAFSSSHDYLLAQIIANDRLVLFLNNQIESINNPQKIPHVEDMGCFQDQDFNWTDSKSALIELIYALHTNKSINKGKCDIRELTAYFEKAFHVKINDIYRGFQDIKSRNSQTKCIDSLKTALQNKIDEDYQ
jgi:hypothetical protein